MNKKILFVIAIVAMVLVGQDVNAQMKLGGGVVLGTELSLDDDGSEGVAFGIGVKGLYELNESFSIAPGFTYFFPSAPDGFDITEYAFDVDAHYNFVKAETLKVYAIGGLNYSYADVSYDDDYISIDGSDSKVGFDLGAGLRTGGDTQFYGEVKYNSAFENVIASVGVLFSL